MTHWGESAHPKMERIVQELHITNPTIKSQQHGGSDLKRQEWYNVRLLVGWLNREWAKAESVPPLPSVRKQQMFG